jgi:uncharacterized protein
MSRTNTLSLSAVALALILAGCASPPTQLADLPRTPDASVEQILRDASRRSGAEANLLRLHAATVASENGRHEQVRSILADIPQSDLPPDQQLRFSELQASSSLALGQPSAALRALQHPSLRQLESLPLDEQVRIQLLRADAQLAAGSPLNAARERVFVDGLLTTDKRQENHRIIWDLINRASTAELQQSATGATGEFAGWLQLALIPREQPNLDMQVRAVESWRNANAGHPAATDLPGSIGQLLELYASRPRHIGLLLPFRGPLASAAQALRDGFLAAQYQAHAEGLEQPKVTLYDTAAYPDLTAFYRQAQADGVQWVVGPLERDQVTRLANMGQLPLPTLALNYTDSSSAAQHALFQFGLAPEDEARSAAYRAWDDGHRSMAALVAQTDWGQRAYLAFAETWQALGGTLIGRETIDQPATIANQIADLLRIRQSEQRGERIRQVLGSDVVVQPTPRNDLHALFLAAGPQQARQIKPTLAFQYAADLPVYATSHVYQLGGDPSENADLDGIFVAEIPWLLTRNDSLYDPVSRSWPQASGALGRLYAMGVDAQRVFTRLPQMQEFSETRVEGATGTLQLAQDGRIERRLQWGVIRDGRIVPLDESSRQ